MRTTLRWPKCIQIEQQKVQIEDKKVDNKNESEKIILQLKMLDLELKKMQEDNKMTIEGIKAENSLNIAEMQDKTAKEAIRFNELMDITKRALDNKATLELEREKARLKPKEPKKPKPQ